MGRGDRRVGVLPAEVTSFVGRTAVLDAVIRRLRQVGTRLVTLTGPGGVGKTRVALRVAHTIGADYSDGCWMVDLAEIETDQVDLVVGAVAAKLGITGTVEDLLGALTDELAGKRALIVLDNCEHAIASVPAVVRRLLQAAPDLVVLATSREKLGVSGEQVVTVPPLALTGGDELPGGEAVRLFMDRAAAVGTEIGESDYRDATELCEVLDGLPLAIELAAGRLGELTVAEMLEQLTYQPLTAAGSDSRFDLLVGGPEAPQRHHEALHRTLEWSRTRLPEAEQRLWARLAVFSGGFELAAARAVCADGIVSPEGVLPALTRLVRHSIVSADRRDGRTRYHMLNTVRQFAFQLISAEELEAARCAHARYFRDLMSAAAKDWVSPREIRWMHVFQQELPNIRASLSYYFSSHHHALRGAEMAVDISRLRHWAWTSVTTEMQQWLADGVKAHPPGSTPLLVRLLANQAWAAVIQGNCDSARSLISQARAAAEHVTAPDLEALLLYVEGTWLWLAEPDEHAAARAIEVLTHAYEASRQCDPPDRYAIFYFLTLAVVFFGDADDARSMSRQVQEEAGALGAQWSVAWTWWTRGMTELVHGETAHAAQEAVALFQHGLRMQQKLLASSAELAESGESAWGLWGVACAAAHGHDLVRAARLLGASQRLQLVNKVTLPGLRPWQRVQQHAQALVVAGLGDNTFAEEVALGTAMDFDEAVDLALLPVDAASSTDVRDTNSGGLSSREYAVAALVASGLTSKEIGERLFLSPYTVDRHVARSLAKLGLPNRIALASWWRTHRRQSPRHFRPGANDQH